MELPAGTLVLYPSALLLHFNVNIDGKYPPHDEFYLLTFLLDVLKVTSDGSHPTPENVRPLNETNSPKGGRGSMVWFTQATMLMSAQLPTATKREADEMERKLQEQYPSKIPHFSTSFDVAQALADNFFPVNAWPNTQ